MSLTQKYQSGERILKYGKKTDVLDEALCDRIRKKLGLTDKELTTKTIRKITDLANNEIAQWCIDNADGCKLHKDMGILSVSKQMPKELRDDKGEILEKIYELDISELRRKQILRTYGIDMPPKVNYTQLKEFGEKVPLFSLNTFFYTYRLIWFNHRNCRTKKARIYRLEPTRSITRRIYDKALGENKEYYELQFSDYYARKMDCQL